MYSESAYKNTTLSYNDKKASPTFPHALFSFIGCPDEKIYAIFA